MVLNRRKIKAKGRIINWFHKVFFQASYKKIHPASIALPSFRIAIQHFLEPWKPCIQNRKNRVSKQITVVFRGEIAFVQPPGNGIFIGILPDISF